MRESGCLGYLTVVCREEVCLGTFLQFLKFIFEDMKDHYRCMNLRESIKPVLLGLRDKTLMKSTKIKTLLL